MTSLPVFVKVLLALGLIVSIGLAFFGRGRAHSARLRSNSSQSGPPSSPGSAGSGSSGVGAPPSPSERALASHTARHMVSTAAAMSAAANAWRPLMAACSPTR